MARHVITPHRIGWTSGALELKKAAEKAHKENRKKAWKTARKKTANLGMSFIDAAKEELTNKWNILPPVFIMRVGIKMLRGIGAIIGWAVTIPIELGEARKKSLAMKKGAEKMVGYSVFWEMQRDPALKKTITGLVKDKGLKWLYVNKSGQIVLSDRSNYSQLKLDEKFVLPHPPRVDMEELIKKANVNYVDATNTPNHTMVGLRGNTITISYMAQGRSEAARVKSGAIKAKAAKPSEEMIRKDELLAARILPSGIAGKRSLIFLLNDGTTRSLVVEKDEAEKIFNRLKK